MIWLISCKGMLGIEIARQLVENKIKFVGTDIDVDITTSQVLALFVKGKEILFTPMKKNLEVMANSEYVFQKISILMISLCWIQRILKQT